MNDQELALLTDKLRDEDMRTTKSFNKIADNAGRVTYGARPNAGADYPTRTALLPLKKNRGELAIL